MTREEGSLVRFIVSSDYGEHDVTCVNSGTTIESVNCHCRKMQRDDIPCAHVFRVLTQLGISDMPRCCVAVRWTMQGKDAFEPERNVGRHIWTEQMDRYRDMRNKANSALFKASMSMEKSHRVLEFLKSLSDDDVAEDDDDDADSGESDDGTETGTFDPVPAYFSGSKQAFKGKIKDPIPIKPRGAPSKKRPKAFYEKFNSRNKAGDI